MKRRFSLTERTCHMIVSRAFALLLVSPLWLGISSTWAVPLSVTNAGFEDISGETVVNEFTFSSPPGWDLYDPDVITGGGAGATFFVGTLTPFEPDPIGNPGVFVNFPGGAAEGQRVGIAFNFEGSGDQGEYGLTQVLSDTLQPNTQYTLQVEIGNIASGTSLGGQSFNLDGFSGYRVDLLAGGVVLASDDNSLFGTIPDGEFGTSTIVFTSGANVPASDNLEIRLVNLNEIDPAFPGSDLEVDFDDVRLDATPVPTPTSLALFAASVPPLLFARLMSRRKERRNRKQA